MHGDILSDLAGELAGALGMSPSLNAGDEHAMAQAAHGCAPNIAGQGIANPVGMMLSGAMLLRWLGDHDGPSDYGDAAQALETGVLTALERGHGTADLGLGESTAEFEDAVHAAMPERADLRPSS